MTRVWQYEPDHFDRIHMRQLTTTKHLPLVVQEAFRCVKSGGWVEHRAIIPERGEESWDLWMDIYSQTGREFNYLKEMKHLMVVAGFELRRHERISFRLEGCCLNEARSQYDIEGEISVTLADLGLQGTKKLANAMREDLGQVSFVW